TVWTGPKPTIVVSSPRVAADLLDRRSKIYSSRPRFVVMGELATGGNALLFLPYGPKWLNQRRLYHQALAGKAADTYRPIQELEAKRLCHDFLHLTSPDGWEKHIQRFAASSVVAIAYGRRVDDVNVGFVQSVIQRMEEVGRTNLPGKQILDSYPFLQSLPEFLTPYKRTYRAARLEGHSFWMSLANTVKERMEKGTAAPSFTRDLWERRGEIGINEEEFGLLTGGIFGAGEFETTAGTLIAFVLAMVTHPEAQSKAQEELDRVVGTERSPTWDDEENLPYCRSLMKEVLRWRPVAVLGGTPHASTEDDVYEGFFIPKGSTILCNLWAIHHDEEYFPEPDKFDPERYLNGAATAYPQKHGHSAFGWGRRICPGQHVAERGVFIVILHLLHHFTLSTPKDRPAPDIFAFTDGFNSRAEPFPLAVEVRGVGAEK
ncbi:cytochrome P450, partial [Leucosporidium creatinivorum]